MPNPRPGPGAAEAVSAVRCRATVAVLVYHSIATVTTRSFAKLTIDPALFDEHLAALREQLRELIPFGEVPAAVADGRQAIAITIDDGLADSAVAAAPALLRHELSATLFVPSGYLGATASWLPGEDGERPMLSWGALAELVRVGFEIGSHGKLHVAADVNPVGLVRRDAADSRSELQDKVGQAVLSFAYPFGYHSPPAHRVVRDVGSAQACAVGDLPAQADDDRWALPRLQVVHGTTREALLAMVGWQPTAAARGWACATSSAKRGPGYPVKTCRRSPARASSFPATSRGRPSCGAASSAWRRLTIPTTR
jgi:peptidoglycan/xylan/chitin deacetylase (PgdA/CDA1 family)